MKLKNIISNILIVSIIMAMAINPVMAEGNQDNLEVKPEVQLNTVTTDDTINEEETLSSNDETSVVSEEKNSDTNVKSDIIDKNVINKAEPAAITVEDRVSENIKKENDFKAFSLASAKTLNNYEYMPIYSDMENIADIDIINNTITGADSEVVLSEDKVRGNFSARIIAAEENKDYIEAKIVASATFKIDEYSQVKIWIKPAKGSEWIEFYTSSSIVKSDNNSDGKFNIGDDLEMGKWNCISLDLTQTEDAEQGKDIEIRVNKNSEWLFDDIHSGHYTVHEVDLKSMVTENTEFIDEKLLFVKNDENTFNSSPIVLVGSLNNNNIGVGKLAKIKLDYKYEDSDSNATDLYNEIPFNGSRHNSIISGNGRYIIYTDKDDNQVYKLNLLSGDKKKLFGNDMSIDRYTDISYNGDVLVSINQNQKYRAQDNKVTEAYKPRDYREDVRDIQLYDNGDISAYISDKRYSRGVISGPKNYYDKELYGSSVYYSIAKDNEKLIFITTHPQIFVVDNGVKKKLYQGHHNITDIVSNRNGSYFIFKVYDDSNLYIYNMRSKSAIKIDNIEENTEAIKVLFDNSFILKGPKETNVYKPSTGELISISEQFSYGTMIDSHMQRYIKNSKVSYINKPQEPMRVLLSFNNKSTWLTYKNNKWLEITKVKPTDGDFDEYGMTIDEVNSLKQSDFASLYQNNKQIYNVDFAIRFASLDLYTTPSIKSIKVIIDESNSSNINSNFKALTNELYGHALYSYKSKNFDGTNWRKINKLHSTEVSPKQSKYKYVIYVDNKYYSYKNSKWIVLEDYSDDIKDNWIDISRLGMSADELRSIPKEELTSKLAGKMFTIGYFISVKDKSTNEYESVLNIDYVKDLFNGSSLILNILLSDGTTKTYNGLSDEFIEEFMYWISQRQFNKGSIFYTIKDGSKFDFINYYMIQSVSVEEK